MRIEISDLRFSAGKKEILRGVNASFEGRKIYGVIGPNGCGKTTLLKHLYRMYPARGRIFVDGAPIERYSAKQYARKVAVMAQIQSFATAELDVREVVQTGRYPYKRAMQPYGREDTAIVDAVLRETGLHDLRDRKVRTLSGGELQRVLIAKCLAQQPELILLDEPTNHLDIRGRLELMRRLRTFDGMVILTIHDLNLAARYCDYIYLMKDGQIRAGGAPREVLCERTLEEAFLVKLDVLRRDGEIFIGI